MPRYPDLLAQLAATRTAGVLLGLDRSRAVLSRLSDPQSRALSVHIAGTNGKGSTAAMTEAILRAAGIRSGLYTSPHLHRFTERIRVDGREVDGDRLAILAQPIFTAGVPLTYFEVATILAFLAFADAQIEVAVLETGLGGRLDATNTCAPVATAITSIGLDHTELLGSTLAEIAREKAGIAKPGVPLYLAPVPAEADAAIATYAAAVGARVLRLGPDFSLPPYAPALAGRHQMTNAAIAVGLAQEASAALGRPLDPETVARGLSQVSWPGRLEWVGEDVLFDCAHNLDGALALRETIDRISRRPRALVFSVVMGKAAGAMLAALAPSVDAIFLTESSSERALAPEILAGLAPPECSQKVVVVHGPRAAFAAARARVGKDGVVIAAGSSFLIGDLRGDVLGEIGDPIPTSDPLSIVRR